MKNILTEFALWLDAADPYTDAEQRGDFFFVGFNTGEPVYYGHRWYATPTSDGDQTGWARYRYYYPELAEKVRANGGVLHIMWMFHSDGHRHEEAQGAWLDNLSVERYIQPAASVGCENTDPWIQVPGAPGDGQVSKGLNLPPASEDNTWRVGLDPALITRLAEANVHWVRLEFIVQPSAFMRLRDNTSIAESIDLKHYDRLIDVLCANNIGVLGLLTYQTVADRSWQAEDGQGQISDSYLHTFTRTTSSLLAYFDDRIHAWEVWNEPDYAPTGLAADQFAKLLLNTSPLIHAANDVVVFGGLANVDSLSQGYFDQFYVALAQAGGPATPYDIFAVHPYPSYEYVDRNGQLLLEPRAHWRQETPTVLAKFQEIMQGRNDLGRDDSQKEIWVTEFGWNSAQGSEADADDRCVTLEPQWVTVPEQTLYVGAGLDVLFRDTAWPGEDRPSVTKAFLYQYQDTSLSFASSECAPAPRRYSPSWWSSAFRELIYGPPPEQSVHVPWSYGLYDGNLQPKPTLCTFQSYPAWLDSCYDFDHFVYLPTISSGQTVTAASE